MKTILTLIIACFISLASAQTYNIISYPAVKITVNQDHSITYTQEGLNFSNPISSINLNYAFGTIAGGPSQWKVVAVLTSSDIVGGVLTYRTPACELVDPVQFAANCVIKFTNPQDYGNSGCSTQFWRRPGITYQGMGYPTINCAGGVTGTDLPFTGCSPSPIPALPVNDCLCDDGRWKVKKGGVSKCVNQNNCIRYISKGWTSDCNCQ